MSLEKAIKHGKEWRKPYRGAKAVDSWCRVHGACNACTSNRLTKHRRKQQAQDEQLDNHLRLFNDIINGWSEQSLR